MKTYFLFLVLALGLVNAASDEEFGVWMKGPQGLVLPEFELYISHFLVSDDMCLNTNTTMPGQLASYLIASADQGFCCIGCHSQEGKIHSNV